MWDFASVKDFNIKNLQWVLIECTHALYSKLYRCKMQLKRKLKQYPLSKPS